MQTPDHLVQTHRSGSILGISIGGVLAVMGVLLLASGLTGSIEWLVKTGGFSSKIINASPGLIVVMVGVILAINFKPRVCFEYEIKRTQTSYHEKGSGVA